MKQGREGAKPGGKAGDGATEGGGGEQKENKGLASVRYTAMTVNITLRTQSANQHGLSQNNFRCNAISVECYVMH